MSDKYSSFIMLYDIDDFSITEAKKQFMAYRQDSVIKNPFFDDSQWIVTDEMRLYTLDFVYREDLIDKLFLIPYDTFVLYLKVYVLYLMGSHVLQTIQNLLNEIDNYILYKSGINKKCSITLYSIIYEFLSLLPENENYDYLDIFNDIDDLSDNDNSDSLNQRDLAAFDSYISFGELISEFWENCDSIEDKLFYFPIFLWWNITGIIPTRPIEYLLTQRNCLRKMNGKWKITLRKNNTKGSKNKSITHKIDEDYIKVEFEIPEYLANSIQWYIENTNENYCNSLNTLFSTYPHYKKLHSSTPITSIFYTMQNLNTSLKYFYKEYIESVKGYTLIRDKTKKYLNENEIQLLQLGDTRHIALINLIAEGATPMIAMILAGHKNPVMSAHYYSNITSLIECKVYRKYRSINSHLQDIKITKSIKPVKYDKFVVLPNNARCYSPNVYNGNYEDCYKVIGSYGELGQCNNSCTYYREENIEYYEAKDQHLSRIKTICETLSYIISQYRKGLCGEEDVYTILLNLKSSEYSYEKYLEESGDF